MPLALDYRPTTLTELAGNADLKKSIGGILKRPVKEIPHAFLFYGLSGGGKTTLGGIVANHLKCDPLEIYEINSANFRGIDTARELEKSIRYAPMRGDVRIWIFNECHMWLQPAQNAMLDVIEKAPAHVYFILTTTDPHKLVTPLRKRCVEYEVLPLNNDEMFNMLGDVCDLEKANVPDDILDKIVAVAGGSSRNGLQLLEKVIDLSPADMKTVSLKLDDEEAVAKDLIDALMAKAPWATVADVIKRITAEPETVRYSVMGYAGAIMLNCTSKKDDGKLKQAALIMEFFSTNFYDSGKNGLIRACYSVII